MTDYNYSIATDGDKRGVVVAFNPTGSPAILIANPSHPSYDEIVAGLRAGTDGVLDLFDVGSGVAKRFKKITDRVSWDGRNILWDGDPVHNTLADTIMRMLETGEDGYEALAKFWENLESNPVAHSREQAYDWLAAHDFKINSDGYIIGYKGLVERNGVWESWRRSESPDKPSAYVDGVAIEPLRAVPNAIGTVVSMPRSEVEHDPTQACSRGLHVATHGYAASYGKVAAVLVNPRDIVSVPTDAHGEKVRVNEYRVSGWAEKVLEGREVVAKDVAYSWAGDVGTKV